MRIPARRAVLAGEENKRAMEKGMKARTTLPAAAALLMLAAQPASAADLVDDPGASQMHTGAFAGVRFRVGFGERRPDPPTARLSLGMTHFRGDGRAEIRSLPGSTLELGITRRGRADLYVGGQRLQAIQQRFGLAPFATAVLVVGSLAAGGLAVSELTDEDLDRVQCFLPEKELCTEG